MKHSFKQAGIKWAVTLFALMLVVGCSNLGASGNPAGNCQNQKDNTTINQSQTGSSSTNSASNKSSAQTADPTKTLLLDMRTLAEQGKVINCDFPAKTTGLQDVEKAWGKADSTDYIAAAKGRYATYASHNINPKDD